MPSVITCPICGKHCTVQKGRKFCSRACSISDQKGRLLPHNAKWEANRIAAVRKASVLRKGKKTGPRPVSVIKAMQDGLKKWHQDNPQAARKTAIGNLPKNSAGHFNGNWRGGKTSEIKNFYVSNGVKFRKWRAAVLQRDGGICKQCGATGRLDAHHILPLSKSRDFAFKRMNGVLLCRKCHSRTDSFGAKGRKNTRIGKFIYIQTIPHAWQDYDTVGNYTFSENGSLLILVSEMRDDRFEFLVALHEMIEAYLCRQRGITDDVITAFDEAFEAARPEGNIAEPGDDPAAPYQNEHCIATAVERVACAALGVKWADYEKAVLSVGEDQCASL